MQRSTITPCATLACGLLAGLIALGSARAETAPPSAAPPSAAPAAQTQPASPQAAPAPRGAPAGRIEKRRRPTYAACNRMARNRGLRGGARRRFLVRCKLGYERPRTPPSQPSAAPARQP